MDPFKRKPSVELFTMKCIVMLEWLKKKLSLICFLSPPCSCWGSRYHEQCPCVVCVLFSKSNRQSNIWFVDSVHRRLSPWDHLVKSRQLGSSGQQFANFVPKNLPRECSLPTANLSDQALDNAHGAWLWLSDIKCKKSETSLCYSSYCKLFSKIILSR